MSPASSQQPPSLRFDRKSLTPGLRVSVAVSGGADSVALLRAVHNANQTGGNGSGAGLGVGLSAAHLHHGLRGAEAEADLEFVTELCATLDVPLHTHRVDVGAHAAGSGETIEEAGRSLRYAFFTQLLRAGEADAILTGHTLDDQAETVLMKLLRGAWTEGLGGIHPVVRVDAPGQPAKQIVRPLLGTSRAEVEAYLRGLGQPWRDDLSNQDPAFTRNRLRHDLLPGLHAFNPSLDRTLSQLSEIAREEEVYWQAELDRLLPHLLLPGKPVRGGGRAVSTAPAEASVAFEIERLRPFPGAVRRRILRAAARQLGARLSFDETERLLALCGFVTLPTVAARNGVTLRLAHGLRAERSLRELRLSRSAALTA